MLERMFNDRRDLCVAQQTASMTFIRVLFDPVAKLDGTRIIRRHLLIDFQLSLELSQDGGG